MKRGDVSRLLAAYIPFASTWKTSDVIGQEGGGG